MNENLKNKRNARGITLVALVVTIVVLLILAGVSIIILFGESGIINKAQKAKQETENGVEKETTGIDDLEWEMIIASGNVPKAERGVIISTKYAKYTDSTSTEPVYVPGGYCIVNDVDNDTNTIANGLVISDLAGDTLDNEPIGGVRGNQFVWVPVSEEQLQEMYGTDKDGKQHGKLYNFTSTGKTNNNWSETNKVMSISNTSGITSFREPDIGTGKDDGTGTSYDGSITNLNIITDLKTKTPTAFKEYLQKEFDTMIESVKKYKGFYIGRYETGDLSKTKAVVQKGNSDLANANWYNQYQKIKNMAQDNSNVETSMIWGCQWDRILEWIVETNLKADGTKDYSMLTNSSSWGNYNDATFTYINSSGVETTKASGTNTLVPTGSSAQNQKNHIYDLAGNVRDWTIETNRNLVRVLRRRLLRLFRF